MGFRKMLSNMHLVFLQQLLLGTNLMQYEMTSLTTIANIINSAGY